jgi:hypothetical protein
MVVFHVEKSCRLVPSFVLAGTAKPIASQRLIFSVILNIYRDKFKNSTVYLSTWPFFHALHCIRENFSTLAFVFIKAFSDTVLITHLQYPLWTNSKGAIFSLRKVLICNMIKTTKV